MLTIFNPTNEVFKMTFAGMDLTMNPGERRQVDDSAGNHLLSGYGRRGLCQLVYGDKEEEVGQVGRSRNLEFKKDQIANYNIQNEQRKMAGLGYLKPTPTVQKYAVELGISLIEPYTLKDAEKSEISNLMKENQDLKNQMAEIMKMVVGLVEAQTPKVMGPALHAEDISSTAGPPKGKTR